MFDARDPTTGRVVVVAVYDPPGNIRGTYASNVPPPRDISICWHLKREFRLLAVYWCLYGKYICLSRKTLPTFICLLITWQTRKWWGVHINTTKLWINQCCGEKTHKSGVPWCYIKGKTSQKKTSFILGIAQITVNINLGRRSLCPARQFEQHFHF